MTAYSTDGVRDAIAGLVGTGAAVPLTDPVRIAEVVDGARQAYADVCKERDELAERLRAVRQTAFPYLREPTQRGELARDIEAEADPHPEADAGAPTGGLTLHASLEPTDGRTP